MWDAFCMIIDYNGPSCTIICVLLLQCTQSYLVLFSKDKMFYPIKSKLISFSFRLNFSLTKTGIKPVYEEE